MKRTYLLWPLALLVAAVVIYWSDGPVDIDDAPITYRYAENLAAGKGFVYNPGEHILGTSTPLYTLLLALFRLIGLPVPIASAALNFVGSLAVVLLTMRITQRLSGSVGAALLAALYLILQGSFVRYTMAGMETPLYTALILLTFWLAMVDRFTLAAFVAALAALMRLDGLAVGGALFLAYLLYHRRLPWRALLIYGLTLLPWTLFAFTYFGSPIPLSLLAKQEHMKLLGHSRYWIWEFLFTRLYGAPTFLLSLALIGVVTFLRRHGWSLRWTTLLIWFSAYLTAYTLVGIDFYEWYAVPVYPILAIFVGAGLHTLWVALTSFLAGTPFPQLPAYLAATLIFTWFIPYGQHLYSAVSTFQQYLVTVEEPRVLAGQWLRDHTPLDATVYDGAIGHVGYQSERYIIDGAGLITPLAQVPTMHRDYYAMDGRVADEVDCGLIQEFITPNAPETMPMLISACHQPPYAEIGDLTLANLRIGRWVQKPNHQWSATAMPMVELQWRIAAVQPPGEWAVYMHFLDAQGQRLFQTDHRLGLQSDGSVRALDQWSTTERVYTYVALPDDWPMQQANVATLRIGVWNPTTQEYLPIRAVRSDLANQEGLIVPINAGKFYH